MRVLLIPLGSEGDVLPFLWLGAGLRARGHEAILIASEPFRRRAEATGLGFSALGSIEDYHRVAGHPDLWNPRKGFAVWADHVVKPTLRPMYDLICQHHQPGNTVLVACGFAFGARIAHERLGIPLATIHLQPAMLRSIHDRPLIAGLPGLDILPAAAVKWIYAAIDRVFSDRLLGPTTNRFRRELGLPPVRRLLDRWWNSPQRVIGLFPEWYAPVQPDWPAGIRLTGFPLCDGAGAEAHPPELSRYLAAGQPPVVFTPGSAMFQARPFFTAAVEACRLLGIRGILLTRSAGQVPGNLPGGVVRFDYVPFGGLLPRTAALVHHGGIGTASQALAAGIPQVIVPFAADQPDNARRLVRLGVGRAIAPQRLTGPRLAHMLRQILESPPLLECCRQIAARFRGNDPLAATCDLIENLARGTAMESGKKAPGSSRAGIRHAGRGGHAGAEAS